MRFFYYTVIVLFLFIGKVSAKEINIKDRGAAGDGVQLVTQIIQGAINDITEEGGTVVFPSGKYLTGTIYMKSNVTLRLEKGAVILGSTDLKQYPENLPDYTFFRKGTIKRALIYAEKCHDIAIEGEGTVDGQGAAFEEPKDKSINSYSVRPYVIWMIQCENVRTEGIKLRNSALWMQHYLACTNVYIHDIEVYNHSNKNNDMMDIDGCRDVIISDCVGDTDDDGITLKSTHSRPNENITITNCILSSHCNAVKCGTESNAGFKNITITNCVIRPSKDTIVMYGKPKGISGISLEAVDGAEMNGVNISNIIMVGPEVPLFIRLGNRGRGYDNNLPKPGVGSIENIMISNITAFGAGATGSSITGIPGYPVKHVTLENIRIYYSGGGTKEDAARSIPEEEKGYPEATMFDRLPGYGMYIRHAENITLKNIEFRYQSEDARPPLFLEDVKNGIFENLKADTKAVQTFFEGRNVQEIYIDNPWPYGQCQSVVSLTGINCESVRLTNIQLNRFKRLETLSVDLNPAVILEGTIFK